MSVTVYDGASLTEHIKRSNNDAYLLYKITHNYDINT